MSTRADEEHDNRRYRSEAEAYAHLSEERDIRQRMEDCEACQGTGWADEGRPCEHP